MKTANRQQLLDFAAAAVRSGHGHIRAAEVLLEHGGNSYGQTYSQAALAVEEFGKAAGVMALAMMPDEIRARAPVKELLERHLLKHCGALLTAALGFGGEKLIAENIAAMPVAAIAEMLESLMAQARAADGGKMRGIYADIAADGTIREPSQVTEHEAREQLASARETAAVADKLVAPLTLAALAELPQSALDLSSALFSMWLDSGPATTSQEAAQLASDAARHGAPHISRWRTTPGSPSPAARSPRWRVWVVAGTSRTCSHRCGSCSARGQERARPRTA